MTLIFKDSTEHECRFDGVPWAGEVDFTLLHTTLLDAMMLLSDKDKTEDMVIKDGDQERSFHGYTVIQALVLMGADVRCVMRQEESA